MLRVQKPFAAFVLASLVGCAGGQGETEGAAADRTTGAEQPQEARPQVPDQLIDGLPAGAHGLVQIDATKLREVGILTEALARLPSTLRPDEVAGLRYAAQRVDEVAVALEGHAGPSVAGQAVLLRGRFEGLEELAVFAQAKSAPRAVAGLSVLWEGGGVVLVRIDERHLLAGPERMIPAVLAAFDDPARRAVSDSALAALLSHVDLGAQAVAFAAVLPQEVKQGVTASGGGRLEAMALRLLEGIDGVSGGLVAADPVALQLSLHTASERQAADLGGLLQLVLSLGAGEVADPDLRQLLSTLRIEIQGARIVFGAQASRAQILTKVDQYLPQIMRGMARENGSSGSAL